MGLASFAAATKGKPVVVAEEEETAEDPQAEYGDILAETLGVPEDRKDDFLEALHGYVRACGGK